MVGDTPENVAGYKVRRRDFLWGRWLKHAQISPFYIRLVRPEYARYTRAINEVLEVAGEVRDLSEPLDHYPFSKGMARWLQKHNYLLDYGSGTDCPQPGSAESIMENSPAFEGFPRAAAASESIVLPLTRAAADQVAIHDAREAGLPRWWPGSGICNVAGVLPSI